LLIVDGAGWHRSKRVEVPDNMRLLFLPAYSPELNPVENLWKEIKKELKNKVFKTMDELFGTIKHWTHHRNLTNIKSICGFYWIREALTRMNLI
jgi:transposase